MISSIFILINLAFGGDFEDGIKAFKSGDYKKAFDFYKKSCDGRNAFGCFNLGLIYDNGQGVKKDKYRAKQFYGKACMLKDKLSCKNYEELNSQGY